MCSPTRSWRTITVRMSATAQVSMMAFTGISEEYLHALLFQGVCDAVGNFHVSSR